jgi:hypothetical protein
MTLDKAIAIAVEAHAGQLDKGGQPYILHPLRLMAQMGTPAEQIVAVLHDVAEDSSWTLDEINVLGLSLEQRTALDALTRRPGAEPYLGYLGRITAAGAMAMKVKIADLKDNLDLSRPYFIGAEDMSRIQKYQGALDFLEVAYRELTTR